MREHPGPDHQGTLNRETQQPVTWIGEHSLVPDPGFLHLDEGPTPSARQGRLQEHSHPPLLPLRPLLPCIYASPSPPSYGRKAKTGHKDPRGQSGGFLKPQERSSLITCKQVNDLFKATWGCGGREQSRKVSPPQSTGQRSGLETKRRIMVFSLVPRGKLDFGILTQTMELKTTQGSCGNLLKKKKHMINSSN